jgi:type 1 glutamine amidotransferase
MKRVLLVTDGWVHPPLRARWILHKLFAEMKGFSFGHVRSLEALPQDLAAHSALVLYLHHKRISPQAVTALAWFVSQGGGILGLHSATASFRDEPRYHQILGGRFVGHGKVEPFRVTPVGGSDTFSDLSSFTVRDELYDHELQPGIEPHFTAEFDGREIPVVWTHLFGRGRVCYTSPGHRAATFRNESYRQVLLRGLAWVCGA